MSTTTTSAPPVIRPSVRREVDAAMAKLTHVPRDLADPADGIDQRRATCPRFCGGHYDGVPERCEAWLARHLTGGCPRRRRALTRRRL